MVYKVIHKPKADVDLDEIYEYFSQFYESTPMKFLDEYHKMLDSVSYSPWFRKWGDTGYRVFNVKRYLVFFKIDEDTETVYIHRVLHGMRDFSRDIELMEERAAYHHQTKMAAAHT